MAFDNIVQGVHEFRYNPRDDRPLTRAVRRAERPENPRGTPALGGPESTLFFAVMQAIPRPLRLRTERSASGITAAPRPGPPSGARLASAVGLGGEYAGRIFEEVKRGPHSIRRVPVGGEAGRAAGDLVAKEV